MKRLIFTTAFFIAMGSTSSFAGAVDNLLSRYQVKNVKEFSPKRGEAMWLKTYKNREAGDIRSCQTCHTKNLKASGKHYKTGEVINPLAPSVNPARFTEIKFIEKWFKRNCKWTLGRECTNQEKGDFLLFLQKQ